jgi:ketosteroid isomerase-like protein
LNTEAQRRRFQRRVDAWLAADLDAYMECWAPDMVIELPSGVIEGRERYRTLVAAGFGWAAPLSFDVHHLAFEAGTGVVLADWTIRARRREDGATIEWRGLSVCRFEGEQIAWWREHHLAPPAAVSA